MPSSRPPVVALVGRPNVGKSTLFNRIVGGRRAIVGDSPGVTRDRQEAAASWRGRSFAVLDTGGIGLDDPRAPDLGEAVAVQAAVALETADAVVLVADAREGLRPLDQEIAETLRKRGAAFVVAANKCDRPDEAAARAADLTRLGAPVFPVSAEHGHGVDELLDAVLDRLPADEGGEEEAEAAVRLAIVGRPNVGKSTLLNRLLGESRAVVSEVPGTTRDPVRARFDAGGTAFEVVDTAGLRRPSRVGTGRAGAVERAASSRAVGEIERADVVVLLLDPAEGPTAEDRRIAALAERRGAGLVVGINKWDRVSGDDVFAAMERDVRRKGGILAHAPVVAVSALSGRGVERLLEAAAGVARRRAARVSTAALNRLAAERLPEAPGGERVKYLTQVAARPPAFALFVGAGRIPDGFLRSAEGVLRRALDLAGVPVRIVLKRPERRPRPAGPRRRRAAGGRR